MDHSPHETDLLDLIEGSLSPDRAERVRASLASDQVLLRRVNRMITDRRVLIDLGDASERAARADRAGASELVGAAVAQAEREALLGPKSRARKTRSAAAAGVALFLSVGLVAAGVALFIRAENTDVGSKRETGRRYFSEGKQERGPKRGFTEPEKRPGAPGDTENGVSPDVPLGLPLWVKPVQDDLSTKVTEDWIREVRGKLARETAGASTMSSLARAAIERVSRGGSRELSVEEAAAVAPTHRLKLIAPSGDALRARARLAELPGLSAREAAPGAVPGERVFMARINAALEPGHAALQDELELLRSRIAVPFGPQPRYELDGDGASGGEPLPSGGVDDVLWWSKSPGDWKRGLSLLIRIEVVPAEPK